MGWVLEKDGRFNEKIVEESWRPGWVYSERVGAVDVSSGIVDQLETHHVGEPLPPTPNDLLVGQRATSLPPRHTREIIPRDTTRLEIVDRVKYRELVFNE